VTQQGTLIMASYMTEQLEKEMEWNDLVKEGRITQIEADEQTEEWEKVRTGGGTFFLFVFGHCFCFV
jgi:hypothetical protein